MSRSFKDESTKEIKDIIDNDLDKNDPQYINSTILNCQIKLTKKE